MLKAKIAMQRAEFSIQRSPSIDNFPHGKPWVFPFERENSPQGNCSSFPDSICRMVAALLFDDPQFLLELECF